ncbi:MAG: hypothetical protein F6J86_40070 [Symploca sp. SIO1B1]|nr:hypothetical protein [Symploca sp. SIO1B1]
MTESREKLVLSQTAANMERLTKLDCSKIFNAPPWWKYLDTLTNLSLQLPPDLSQGKSGS